MYLISILDSHSVGIILSYAVVCYFIIYLSVFQVFQEAIVFKTVDRIGFRFNVTVRMSRVKSDSPTAVTDVHTGSKMQRVIYVTYLIAVLDITWMFLQFSITPVSICVLMSILF